MACGTDGLRGQAWELRADDGAFGGLSSLALEASSVVFVSDQGNLWSADVTFAVQPAPAFETQ